ncbi:MAG: imidazole glycerol phosphate synthase subunit HisH [Chitinivibrionales bacterium]|nr:imidazole glycerol phosphate synthase subunit HisH [Chitinivibrionales bacterium]
MIVIIDAGMGNLGSIFNMLRKVGANSRVSDKVEDILTADKLILPGVGHFDYGMNSLEERGHIQVLNQKVLEEKCPVLGICLGMQLMTRRSEEGKRQGLGWIQADTKRFSFTATDSKLKIPHMGWNSIDTVKGASLFEPLRGNPRFYFVHSYYVVPDNDNDIAARTSYGGEFCSAIQHDNMYGTQFHPEKSHKFGIAVMDAFSKL